MIWHYLKAKWESLVFRLLFYFLVAILALAIVLGISFSQRLKPHVQNNILPNLERYIEYLIADIGSPPDLAVARQLTKELPFELRIEGRGINWSSKPQLESVEVNDFEPAPPPYGGVYFGQGRGAEYLLIDKQGYRYLFAVDNSLRRGSERRHGFLFLFLGLILLVLYLAIRRLFRPIEVMSRQIRRIGEGDLGQSIEISGRGELAQLAAGINHMSARIESMLEGKSALLLAISHELRSPITRMRVNLELLDASDTRQKLIDDIREIENLVATILESEQLNSGHAPLNLSRCDLAELIRAVVRNHACRGRIETVLASQERDVDQMRFGLLLKNLIDNACQYSADGNQPIEVTLRSAPGSAIIVVEDHGIGIAAEDLPRLTEAFYRPDSARTRTSGGYGLGLYLCKLITEAHGGQISLESEPGQGTRVIVTLPLDNS